MKIFYPKLDGTTGEVEIDAAEAETHTSTGTVTRRPVESGVAITDHYRQDPDVLTVSAQVTNTPIKAPTGITGSVQSVDLPLRPNPITGRAEFLAFVKRGQVDTANVLKFNETFDRVTDTYELVRYLQRTGQTVSVETSLRTYDDMVLTSLTVTRDSDRGNVLAFGFTAEQVRFAEVEETDAPEPREPAQPRSQANQNRGRQQTQTEEEEPNQSLLSRWTGYSQSSTNNTRTVPIQ